MAWSGFDFAAGHPPVIPQYLLLPLGRALQAWRSVVRAPDMPTVDELAALQQLTAVLEDAPLVTAQIQEVAYRMAFEDALFDSVEPLTPHSQRQVFDATVYLLVMIAEQLVQIKAYWNGKFPYALEGVLPDDTLIFRSVWPRNAGGAPVSHLGHP